MHRPSGKVASDSAVQSSTPEGRSATVSHQTGAKESTMPHDALRDEAVRRPPKSTLKGRRDCKKGERHGVGYESGVAREGL
jgi:hypothetical protein